MLSSLSTASPFTNPAVNGSGPGRPLKYTALPVVRLASAITGGGPPTSPVDPATTAVFVAESYPTADTQQSPNTPPCSITRGPSVPAATFAPNTNVGPAFLLCSTRHALFAVSW